MVSILVFAVRNISCVSCLLSIRVRAFVLVSLANTFYLFICRVCNWTTVFDTGLELSRVLYEGFFSRSSSGSVLWLSFSVIAKRGQSAANNTRQISFVYSYMRPVRAVDKGEALNSACGRIQHKVDWLICSRCIESRLVWSGPCWWSEDIAREVLYIFLFLGVEAVAVFYSQPSLLTLGLEVDYFDASLKYGAIITFLPEVSFKICNSSTKKWIILMRLWKMVQ